MSTLLERLQKYKENRGMMANLRCALVDSKKHRAWPVLNRLGIRIDDDVSTCIAGLFATHPQETNVGNLGDTCKAIEQKRGDSRDDGGKMSPMERRFQQVLTAERGSELHGRVLRMVLMAKSQGIPVNYGQLATDIKFWTDRTKTQWASAFWSQNSKVASGEEG